MGINFGIVGYEDDLYLNIDISATTLSKIYGRLRKSRFKDFEGLFEKYYQAGDGGILPVKEIPHFIQVAREARTRLTKDSPPPINEYFGRLIEIAEKALELNKDIEII